MIRNILLTKQTPNSHPSKFAFWLFPPHFNDLIFYANLTNTDAMRVHEGQNPWSFSVNEKKITRTFDSQFPRRIFDMSPPTNLITHA